MEFKQSTSIMFSNFSLVFKLLLYVLIVTLIFISLVSAIIIPTFRQITAEENMGALIDTTKSHVDAFMQGNSGLQTTYDLLYNDLATIWHTFLSSQGLVAGIAIGIFLFYILFKFLLSLSFVPTADIINNFMSSNLRYGFVSNFTLNVKLSVKYAIMKTLVYLPIDAVIVAVLLGLLIGFWQIIGLFALPIVLILGVVLFSIRQANFAGWIPRLLFHREESVMTAFKHGFETTKDYRRSLFGAFAIIYFIYWILAVGLSLPTFGLMSLFATPMLYVIMRVIELVHYYKINHMRFYTDPNFVVDTVAVGMRESDQEKVD